MNGTGKSITIYDLSDDWIMKTARLFMIIEHLGNLKVGGVGHDYLYQGAGNGYQKMSDLDRMLMRYSTNCVMSH